MAVKRTYDELEKRVAELELQVKQLQSEAALSSALAHPDQLDIIARKQAEEMLEWSQQLLRNIIDICPFHIVCLDCEGKYIIVNKSYCESFEKAPHQFEGLHYSHVLSPELAERHKPFIDRALAGEIVEFEDSNAPGNKVPQYAYGVYTPFRDKVGEIQGCVAYVVNITDRKKAENELREEKIKLEIALKKVKRLSGLLPICCVCKKIRDDRGYWNQIEVYIRDNSEAELSHSLCQECAKKYYPDIDFDQK